MNYIFLDIDGVLNKSLDDNNPDLFTWINTNDSMKNLYEIVKNTNAKIVLSSNWRRHFIHPYNHNTWWLSGLFAAFDLTITHITGQLNNRNLEINDWLSKNTTPNDRYVILDDINFYEENRKEFIKVNPKLGLTAEDTIKAIRILNE